mmetsp:Transcript_23145/g.29948  ORF Transcript_23145/g.29948 Transcript_23145/m.29948 type:complete len:239 (-) Transcript_23145:1611-2327(-)
MPPKEPPVATIAEEQPPMAVVTNDVPVTNQPTATPLAVGTVVSVVPIVPTASLLTPFEGQIIVAERQSWPFSMLCSATPCCHCMKDCGLCCYVCFCPSCVGAELSEKIHNQGCCGTESCCAQWASAWCTALCVAALGAILCGVGAVCSACVWSVVYAQIRDASKAIYQLPDDELCCDSSITSFIPCFPFDCTCCALYQMAYFTKHVQHQDLDCFLYNTCCNCTKPTPPGDRTSPLLNA